MLGGWTALHVAALLNKKDVIKAHTGRVEGVWFLLGACEWSLQLRVSSLSP